MISDWTAIVSTPGDSWNLLEKLQMLGYQAEPWASRYPACAAIPNSWAAITAAGSTWRDPGGSVLEGNLGWQLGQVALALGIWLVVGLVLSRLTFRWIRRDA